jgi:hypothetical protein
MGVEESIKQYQGNMINLEKIQGDFEKFPDDAFNGKDIEVIVRDSIIVQPHNENEEISQVRIPNESSWVDIDYTNGKTRFNYQKRQYVISREKRF